jgi:hypothetical protein
MQNIIHNSRVAKIPKPLYDDKCFVYKYQDNQEVIYLRDTDVHIIEKIDYGGSSQIFSTNKDIIVKMSFIYQNEIAFLIKARPFIIQNITMHFIILYGYSQCEKLIGEPNIITRAYKRLKTNNGYAKSTNAEIIEYFYNTFHIMLLEKFDTNVSDILHNEKNPYYKNMIPHIKTSILAQVIISLLTFHCLMGAIHDDAQLKNFFVKYYSGDYSNSFIHYKVYKQDIYIPFHGYLVVIADYGNASYDKLKENKKEALENYDFMKDYEFILDDKTFISIIGKDVLPSFETEKELIIYLKEKGTFFKDNIDQNSRIINNKPYIIE